MKAKMKSFENEFSTINIKIGLDFLLGYAHN